MTAEEMRNEFYALYNIMANSDKVEYMHIFGNVQKAMFEWFVTNKPTEAEEFLNRLEAIRWKQYLTKAEAASIISEMTPKAPWSFDTWKTAMSQYKYDLEREPCYNQYALWVVMNAIMSDSSDTLGKYVASDKLFEAVHDLAVDKLQDEDGRFVVRGYFSL